MVEIDFTVLDSVSVCRGEHRYEITGTKLRTLVLVLASRAGRVVPVDEFVTHLWGDRPPASAVKNVQLYVHRLRQQLAALTPNGAAAVQRSAGGYRLDVARDAVDLLRVQGLLYRGTEAFDRGRWSSCVALLREALSGWRAASPVGVADTVQVDAIIAEIRERRLAAVERLARAELELGGGPHVLDRLRPLAAAHPAREPLHELLIRALALSGDQVQAVQTYHRLRIRLRDDFGLDPNPQTTAAFTQVLEGTSADAAGTGRGVSTDVWPTDGPALDTAPFDDLPSTAGLFGRVSS